MAGISFDITPDDDLTGLVIELREFVPKRLSRAIAREVIPEAQRKLDRKVDSILRPPAPPRGRNKFVWSHDPVKNERGRRGFFARYPNGFNRTGQLGRDWQADITFQNSVIETSIRNDNEGASYVYGSEAYNFVQVPGHKTTGWLNAGETVPDILLETQIEVERGVNLAIDQEIEKL